MLDMCWLKHWPYSVLICDKLLYQNTCIIIFKIVEDLIILNGKTIEECSR